MCNITADFFDVMAENDRIIHEIKMDKSIFNRKKSKLFSAFLKICYGKKLNEFLICIVYSSENGFMPVQIIDKAIDKEVYSIQMHPT